MRGKSLAHLSATYQQRVGFCRYLFDEAGASAATRLAYVKAVAKQAHELQLSGGAVVSTSSAGTSVTFQVPQNWTADDLLSITNEARAWAAAVDVSAALALIVEPRASSVATFAGVSL